MVRKNEKSDNNVQYRKSIIFIKLISFTIMLVPLVTMIVILLSWKKHIISFIIENDPFIAYLTFVGWALIILVAPYVSIHLWKLRKKGRTAYLMLVGYELVYYAIAYKNILLIGDRILACTLIAASLGTVVFLYSPNANLIFKSKFLSFTKLTAILRNLDLKEKLTISTSIIALIISIFNVAITHFYVRDSLSVSISELSLSKDGLIAPITFINTGSTYVCISYVDMAFAPSWVIVKGLFNESFSWFRINKSPMIDHETNFILKPGEMKLVQVEAPSDFPNEFYPDHNKFETILALNVRSIDSKGKSHLSYNEIGLAKIEARRITKITGVTGILIKDENLSKGQFINLDNYGAVFKLH